MSVRASGDGLIYTYRELISALESIEAHVKEKHYTNDKLQWLFNETVSQHVCLQCSQIFDTEAALIVHQVRNDCRQFQCEKCALSFVNKQALAGHMRMHWPRQFVCQWCGKEYTYGLRKERHEETCDQRAGG